MSLSMNEQYSKIYKYCYFKIGNASLAEDLTQETFLKYFNQTSYINRGKQLAYLYTIARNNCIDYLKTKQTQPLEESMAAADMLIIAKITAVITFSILFILTALGIALVTLFSVYPTFGGNVSLQLWEIFTVYPLTMLKAVLIYCGVILCAALLVAAICTFLSSYFSSFATIITTLLLLFGAMFVSIDIESLRTLNYFLPAKMLNSGYVFSQRLVNVFGLYIEPYIFIPILCFIFIAVFLLLGYRGFKNHQP